MFWGAFPQGGCIHQSYCSEEYIPNLQSGRLCFAWRYILKLQLCSWQTNIPVRFSCRYCFTFTYLSLFVEKKCYEEKFPIAEKLVDHLCIFFLIKLTQKSCQGIKKLQISGLVDDKCLSYDAALWCILENEWEELMWQAHSSAPYTPDKPPVKLSFFPS